MKIKIKPLLFSEAMVNAIKKGAKTQTRRIAKEGRACPFAVGDRIWVRETFAEDENGNIIFKADNPNAAKKWKSPIYLKKVDSRIWLEVTGIRKEKLFEISHEDAIQEGLPSQLMRQFEYNSRPVKWYWDFINEDYSTMSPYISYRTLWIKLHGIESWGANPEVWVIDFKYE